MRLGWVLPAGCAFAASGFVAATVPRHSLGWWIAIVIHYIVVVAGSAHVAHMIRKLERRVRFLEGKAATLERGLCQVVSEAKRELNKLEGDGKDGPGRRTRRRARLRSVAA